MAQASAKIKTRANLLLDLYEYERGAMTIGVEPRRWAYPAAYEAGSFEQGYFCVYGATSVIETLAKAECTANASDRLRVDADGTSKAYLNKEVVAEFLAQAPQVELKPECELFGISREAGEPTIALYHTQPAVGDASQAADALSYLVLSARDSKPLRCALERLTDSRNLYIHTNHIGKQTGEFAVIPLRRALADAIARSHPGVLDISRTIQDDPAAHSASVPTAMLHILSQLQGDERFHKEPEIRPPKPHLVERPQTTMAVIEAKPLTYFLQRLAPFITSFERVDKFNGSYSGRMLCTESTELREIMTQMYDARYCSGADRLSPVKKNNTPVDGQAAYTLDRAIYEALKPHAPQAAETVKVEPFHAQWLAARGVQIRLGKGKTASQQERIRALRLVTSHADGAEQAWLIVTAPSTERCVALAQSMGIDEKRTVKLTQPNEKPALLRIPISERMAKHLAGSHIQWGKASLEVENTHYDSLEALDAEQREISGVSVIEASPLNGTKPLEIVKKPKPPRTEADIRAALARLVFEQGVKTELSPNGVTIRTAWAHYTDDTGKPAICLALKVPTNADKEFNEAFNNSGYGKRSKHKLRFVGKTGESVERYALYMLNITPEDVAAWPEYLDEQNALSLADKPIAGFKELYEQIAKHFEQHVVKRTPEEEAWRHLSTLAQNHGMQWLQVRFTAEEIRRMEVVFQRQLAFVESLAGMRKPAEALSADWKEYFPVFLHPALDEVSNSLRKSLWHQFATPLGSLNEAVDQVNQQLLTYNHWLKNHPKQADGSIVIPYLVIARARDNTREHLRVLAANPYKPPEQRAEEASNPDAKKQFSPGVSLFSQKPTTIEGVLGNDKDILLQPVTAAFFSALQAEANQTVPMMQEDPVEIQQIKPFLKGQFYQAPSEVEKLKPPVVDLNREAASRKLLKGGLEAARNLFLYVTLREEHGFDDLAESRVHIGTQAALIFQINQQRDWSQRLLPLLEQLDKAKLLEKRRRYGEVTHVELPGDLQAARAQREKAASAIKIFEERSFVFHLNAVREGKDTSFHLTRLREAAAHLFSAIEKRDFPRELRLHTVLQYFMQLKAVPDREVLERYSEVVNEVSTNLMNAQRECRDQVEALEAKYLPDASGVPKTVTIVQDDEVRFFTENQKEGVPHEAMPDFVRKHFAQPDTRNTPLRCVVYLNNKALESNKELQVALKNMLPNRPVQPKGNGKYRDPAATPQDKNPETNPDTSTVKPAQGRWAARENRPSKCPENVTLAQLFSHEASRYFGANGPGLGGV